MTKTEATSIRMRVESAIRQVEAIHPSAGSLRKQTLALVDLRAARLMLACEETQRVSRNPKLTNTEKNAIKKIQGEIK